MKGGVALAAAEADTALRMLTLQKRMDRRTALCKISSLLFSTGHDGSAIMKLMRLVVNDAGMRHMGWGRVNGP